MLAFFFAAVSLTYGVTFQCEYGRSSWANSQYICVATITSDGNLTHLIDVTGNNWSGKTNVDVQAFWIQSSHQHLNRIPKGIEFFLPNLVFFAWVQGNLTSLKADDLEPFPNMQRLDVTSNKLASLDGDLFKHTLKLRDVYFNENLLEHIGFGLLDGLDSLNSVEFKQNPCIDTYAKMSAAIEQLKLKLPNQCPPLIAKTKIITSPMSRSTTTSLVPRIKFFVGIFLFYFIIAIK